MVDMCFAYSYFLFSLTKNYLTGQGKELWHPEITRRLSHNLHINKKKYTTFNQDADGLYISVKSAGARSLKECKECVSNDGWRRTANSVDIVNNAVTIG